MRSLPAVFLLLILSGFIQRPSVPEFRFVRMDNGQDFTQKNLVTGSASLFVFFDITCSHCQEAMKSFNTQYESLKKVSIYLITKDVKEKSLPFLAAHAPNIYGRKNVTVLYDRYDQFIASFLPKKYPSIFLYAAGKQLLFYSDEPKDIPKLMLKIKAL